jgi:trimeric autotransporter adhesin
MDVNTISNTSIKILDANLNTTGITQGAVTAKANTDNKTFLVPITALPFNNGTFSGVVSVANTVKDAAGNAIAATTKNVTITEDKTAPQVVSATYKKVTSYNGISTPNGAIVIKFNEEVNASAAAASYVVVDDQGNSLTTPISARTVNPNDNTELVLTLGAAVGTNVKTYTVVMPNSAVTDKAIAANASKSANLTVDVSAGAPVATDTTAPAVSTVTPTAATSSTSGTTIAVTFTEAGSGLDTATVTNVNNYRLDGAALPAGSYITISSNTATINIPAGSIAKDKTYALNINGIKDKAGNTMSPYVGSVALKDDIKPVLTAATLNTNGTVSLGFSETVNTAAGKEADFAVILNGVTLNSAAYTLADGVGADAGKYVLSVNTRVAEAAAPGGTDTLYIDVNGNTSFDAGTDIVVAQATDATGTTTNFTAGTYNLNNATSLKVGTIAAPTLVTDTSNLANVVEGSKTITVK